MRSPTDSTAWRVDGFKTAAGGRNAGLTHSRIQRLIVGITDTRMLKLMKTALVLLVLAAGIGNVPSAPSNVKGSARWSAERVRQVREDLDRMKQAGLITERQYRRKCAMLEARLAGTFQPTALCHTNPPDVNLIQNGGFEQVNRNSAPNRSRWLWWGGWSWGGDYENHWETRPAYVHSGRYSARIRCTGRPGRIGISTPKLPVLPGIEKYRFSVWAKGEGDNQLFLNFEAGARGSLRKRIGPVWEQVVLEGKATPGAHDFTLYVYVTGKGTIWLDDARLVPVGEIKD